MTRALFAAGAGAALVLAAAGRAPAQETKLDAPRPHAIGQSVSPSFEGWYENPDGSFSIVFGYLNRNFEEHLDIPVGPDNRIEPAPADRGQPTHFLPRRHTGVFAIRVPADFGEQELTWSLTAHGRTIAIPGNLRPAWRIDALREVTNGNTPPVLRFAPDGEPRPGAGRRVGPHLGCAVAARRVVRLDDRRRPEPLEGVDSHAARRGLEQVPRSRRRHVSQRCNRHSTRMDTR